MAAVFVHQRAGVAELDFQETCPSFQWPPDAWAPPSLARRAAAPAPRASRPPPPAAAEPAAPFALRYHDLTTAAWLDEDAHADRPDAALDAVDRQSWALARLVCGSALAVGALALASYLVG
jgi:hypothetical protein